MGGLYNLNGYNTTVSSLTGTGTISNEGPGTSTITVNATDSYNFGGILRDGFSSSGWSPSLKMAMALWA